MASCPEAEPSEGRAPYDRLSVDARVSFITSLHLPASGGWEIVGASVPGRRKYARRERCEDFSNFIELFDNCGALLVADGAGFAARSDVGAEYVANNALPKALRLEICAAATAAGQPASEFLASISSEMWEVVGRAAVKRTYESLMRLAARLKVDAQALSCTVIVCLIVQERILLLHVGDGRGACRTGSGQWLPLFTPTIGDNPGETVFVGSPIYHSEDALSLIQCHVHEVSADCICIMSDGCEKSAFQVSEINPAGGIRLLNTPFPGFLDAVPPFLAKLSDDAGDVAKAWADFLIDGTPRLAAEQDDKTLVVARRLPSH